MAKETKIVTGKDPIEFESGNVIINKKSTIKFAKELSEINESAGGNPIPHPNDTSGPAKKTTDAKDGGLLVGKSHAEGGMKAVVVDTGQPIEVEGGEAVIIKEAVEEHKEELTRINTDGGNGVPILKKGGELEKGIEIEKEHMGTIQKVYDHEITPEEASKHIAQDHLNEDKEYYSKLMAMESKKGGGKVAKKYYTTGKEFDLNYFVETEVDERGNYELADVQAWVDKYLITENAKLLWVATEPHIAARYQMDASDWDNAKKIYEKNKSDYNVREIESSEGVIIAESDDGDDGYVMLLNKLAKGGSLDPEPEFTAFNNPDIFVEEKDYILGGFTVDELKSVIVVGDTNMISNGKLDRLFRDRIIHYIESFKKSIQESLKKNKVDTSVHSVIDRINDELYNIFSSYTEVRLDSSNIQEDGYYDNEYLADQIMQLPAYRLWRSRIASRVEAVYNNVRPPELQSDKPGRVSKDDAEELTTNVSLQHIFEQLANIIENPDEQ
jgi:hypothetical protein